LKNNELSGSVTGSSSFLRGRAKLERPVWPLCNLFLMLCLASPYERPDALLTELPDEVEAGENLYSDPVAILKRFSDILFPFARFLRGDGPGNPEEEKAAALLVSRSSSLADLSGERPDPFDAMFALCRQDILARELEEINSLLCGPCGCDICCTGPGVEASHDFFEIPLAEPELSLFELEKVDSSASRNCLAGDDRPLVVGDRPFYASGHPLLIHWRRGWSLVMPRATACPNLGETGCSVYMERPEVCRKPQIFPYVIEEDAASPGTYVIRNAILAVWDCPYVRFLRDEIASYAAMNGLETFFRENKV
jgi:Fe-S-cluster containining protein